MKCGSSVLMALAWLTLGCGPGNEGNTDAGTRDSGAPSCGIDYLGDPNAPPEFIPTALGSSMSSEALVDGGVVSLVAPPQGGRVAFIGLRGATNLDPCGATLLAAVKDPISRQVRLDARTVNLNPGPDGKGASIDLDISTFANVPLCPNQWSREAIYDRDYELTVTITDQQSRSVSRTLNIRPACDVPGEEAVCRCLCKKDYTLGESCIADPQDGGT